MKILASFLALILVSNFAIAQGKKTPVQLISPDEKFELIGALGKEFGSVNTVIGIIFDCFHKGHAGGPNLRVQVINGNLTQHIIEIPVSPYFGKFGEDRLPVIKYGSTYRFRVYETGEFVGEPHEAYKEAGILLQTTGFYFQNRLIVISGEKIDPIVSLPDNFIGQNALLSGIAKNENDAPVIQTSEFKLKLIGFRKWTKSETGKLAEVYGKVQKTEVNGTYVVENGQTRLVKLEDQLGRTVKLRGTSWGVNGHWWFNYRGVDIYIEKMSELSNWSEENHGRPMEITGTLEQQMLPRIDQILLKSDPDLQQYYIVRKASWSPIEELLWPELSTGGEH